MMSFYSRLNARQPIEGIVRCLTVPARVMIKKCILAQKQPCPFSPLTDNPGFSAVRFIPYSRGQQIAGGIRNYDTIYPLI
jgi:hypothetical protein